MTNYEYNSDFDSEYEADYGFEEYEAHGFEEHEADYGFDARHVFHGKTVKQLTWDDDAFELEIPKISVPVSVPSGSAAQRPSVPKAISAPALRRLSEEPPIPSKEAEVDLTEFLHWGSAESKPATKSSADKQAFPELGALAEKIEGKHRWGNRKTKFTKLEMVLEKDKLKKLVYTELEIIKVTVHVPNLYLNKKKRRVYCEVAARRNKQNGTSCLIRGCNKAHGIEEYLPNRCKKGLGDCLKHCDEMKEKVEVCGLKHFDETLERFLLRIKLIDRTTCKKLEEVSERNKKALEQEKNKKTQKQTRERAQTEPTFHLPIYEPSNRVFSSFLAAARFGLPEAVKKEEVVADDWQKLELDEKVEEGWQKAGGKRKRRAPAKGGRNQGLADPRTSARPLSKTKQCLDWQKKGKCPRGDKCGFAHGRAPSTTDNCTFGASCRRPNCAYLHPEIQETERGSAFDTLASSTKVERALSKTKLCLHWQKRGKCPQGAKCGFAHGKAELQVANCFFGASCRKRNCHFKHPGAKSSNENNSIKIKAPKDLAMQVVQAAYKTGKNVEVDFR